MSPQVLQTMLQLAISLGGSAVLIRLLTLRQDRRKIAGEASTNEANAASTLSGAALQMVEAAQKSARDAEERANRADVRAEAAEKKVEESRQANEKVWQTLNRTQWRVHELEEREHELEEAMRRAGIIVPERTFGVYPGDLKPGRHATRDEGWESSDGEDDTASDF